MVSITFHIKDCPQKQPARSHILVLLPAFFDCNCCCSDCPDCCCCCCRTAPIAATAPTAPTALTADQLTEVSGALLPICCFSSWTVVINHLRNHLSFDWLKDRVLLHSQRKHPSDRLHLIRGEERRNVTCVALCNKLLLAVYKLCQVAYHCTHPLHVFECGATICHRTVVPKWPHTFSNPIYSGVKLQQLHRQRQWQRATAGSTLDNDWAVCEKNQCTMFYFWTFN